jgi:hypothetical protein
MRLLLTSTALALLFGLSPASAMCGAQQSAGMCGASPAKNMSERIDKDVPVGTMQTPAEQKPGAAMGGCSCCKNMAMMGAPKSNDPQQGMDMK